MSETCMLSPEELNALSRLLSKVYVESLRTSASSETVTVAESVNMTTLLDLDVVRQLDLDVIASSCMGVFDPLGQLREFIVSVYSSVSSWIVSSVTAFISTYVTPTLEGISRMISDAVIPAIGTVSVTVISGVRLIVDSLILPAIYSAQSVIVGVVGGVTAYISTHVVSMLNLIASWIDRLSGVAASILGAIGFLRDSIYAYVLPSFSWLYTSISTFIAQNVVSPLTGFHVLIIDGMVRLSSLVSSGFEVISRTFMGFVNAVLQLPTLFWNTIPRWVYEGWIAFTSFSASLSLFLRDPMAWLQRIVASIWDGLKWLTGKLWDVVLFISRLVWDGVASLWNTVRGGLEVLGRSVAYHGMTLLSGLSSIMVEGGRLVWKSMLSSLTGIVVWSISSVREVSEQLGMMIAEMVSETIKPIPKLAVDGIMKPFIEISNKIFRGEPLRGEFSELLHLLSMYFVSVIGSQALSYGLWLGFHGLGMALDRFELRTPVKIKVKGKVRGSPAGVGGEGEVEKEAGEEVNIVVNFGLLFRELASEVREGGHTFVRSLLYGSGIWMSQPMMRMANALFRNVLPVELPSIEMLIEVARRHMPTAEFTDILDKCRGYFRLYGYNDSVIEWTTKTVEESIMENRMIIAVKDRFDKDRVIPLSIVYQLPSPSDVARMCIRDIFGMGAPAIESFLKVYSARGMHRDIGILYYMLHYRYPSPERLWTFVTRGWSGMLWASIPSELARSIEDEAKMIGAPVPTDARYWNFRCRQLWSALQMYMTWHDYARFTWISGRYIGDRDFTSDNQIVLDTLADIPGRIDQRWMIKWGLYEHLSSMGVTFSSQVKDFALKILRDSPSSGITMDLSLFSRTIQATGLHPDWVPVTCVAESMNVLSEERTLLRAGFLGLFKEGFYDVDALETMLRGFIEVSFKVAFFDSDRLEWVADKWVNIPVMFLPPERKLLELRAIMDRALDILREIQRDLSLAFADNIVLDYEEYKVRLKGIIDYINVFYAEDWKRITGRELPAGLRIKFVEEYYKPYVEGLQIVRDVYTVRRIRSWTMRWLGWIMYRVATGLVTGEELNRLVDVLASYSKLTDREREFFGAVLNAMAGITMREYAPTPQQIATLSEYMVIPNEYIEKMFKVKLIEEDWQKVWRQYIAVRPIADDIKSLIATFRRISLYVKVPEEIERRVREYAKLINFTEREWEVLRLRNELEELLIEYRESKREYIPTPLTLASISEILPHARNYFRDVAEAKRIPEAWRKLWWQYVSVKPLVDEIKRYVSRAEQLYARFMVDEESYIAILEAVSEIMGYERREIEFMLQTARMERVRHAWSELIGDVDRMTMLAEYSPEARGFALATLNRMIDALPIPLEVKDVLKKMWEQFIRIKPVKDEVTSYIRDLINAVVDGVVSIDAFERELEDLRKWGLDDYEIDFYKNIAVLRKARKLRITVA